MTTEFDDGGPAFPCDGGEFSGLHPAPGMSLLDWFAGQALVMFAGKAEDFTCADMAQMAYDVAATMLAESARMRTARVEPVTVAAQSDA